MSKNIARRQPPTGYRTGTYQGPGALEDLTCGYLHHLGFRVLPSTGQRFQVNRDGINSP